MIVHVVFDGPPGPVAGRFVEVETLDGKGINVGRWIKREDGCWALEIDVIPRVRDTDLEPEDPENHEYQDHY
jgi:hypothetical protein